MATNRTDPEPTMPDLSAPALHARTLQLLLRHEGLLADGGVTGRYDPATGAAVRAFQRSAGLPVTGVAGPATADALLARGG